MEDRKEGGAGGAGWLSVPAFGDWDQKNGGVPDYSVDFSKIREMRKQNKTDFSRLSVGNDDELINPTATRDGSAAGHHIVGRGTAVGAAADAGGRPHHRRSGNGSPTKKAKIMRYLNCCVTA